MSEGRPLGAHGAEDGCILMDAAEERPTSNPDSTGTRHASNHIGRTAVYVDFQPTPHRKLLSWPRRSHRSGRRSNRNRHMALRAAPPCPTLALPADARVVTLRRGKVRAREPHVWDWKRLLWRGKQMPSAHAKMQTHRPAFQSLRCLCRGGTLPPASTHA